MDKKLTYLLKDALTDIENLQEYYISQKEYVYQYVDKNIEKYRYGIFLDRFFFNMVFDIDDNVVTEKEQKLFDEIITEYHIEDADDGKVISFILNPEKDFSGYEMEP